MKKMGVSRGFYPYLPLPNSVPVDRPIASTYTREKINLLRKNYSDIEGKYFSR